MIKSRMGTDLMYISFLRITIVWTQFASNLFDGHYFTLHQILCEVKFNAHPCERGIRYQSWWLSGWALTLQSKGCEFESPKCHDCVKSKTLNYIVTAPLPRAWQWVRSEYCRWLPLADFFTIGTTMVPIFTNKIYHW
jgi:hypothetical protein